MPPIFRYRIVGAEGGRWMVLSPAGEAVRGDLDYPTPELAAEAVVSLARGRGKGARMIRDHAGRPVEVEVDEGPGGPTGRTGMPVRVTLEVSPEFREFLDAMAGESGEDRAEVVRKALGLLRIARDARREGNGLAIVTPDFEVDQEITGF